MSDSTSAPHSPNQHQDEHRDYVHWFRHSAPYINAHRGQTFVLLLSGETIAQPDFAHIVHDIALLNSLGVRLVLVCGARSQIDQRLHQAGLTPQRVQGRRITDNPTLDCVKQAVGSIRFDIEALLSMGVANTPMHGARIRVCSGNFVTAKPIGVVDGIDHHHTGNVRRIDTLGIHRELDDGKLVLLTPIGFSPTGEAFNLTSEAVAARAATALQANKLIAFTEQQGLFDEQQQLLRVLTPSTGQRLLQQLPLTAPLRPLLDAACRACSEGVPRCHLISYREEGSLLTELFTHDGAGSMMTEESYEQPRTATIEDVGGILELIEPLEKDGALVRRSRERLEQEIHQFTLIEQDGMVIACAALYPFAEQHIGELACVATHPDYRKGDRGRRLLESIEQQARQRGLKQLFVLTTRTAHWFQEQGFVAASLDQLPTTKQTLYNFQRNSKIFIKPL